MSKFTEFTPSVTPVSIDDPLFPSVVDENFALLQQIVNYIGQDLKGDVTIADSTSGNVNVTLPPATTNKGERFTFKKIVAANSVVISSADNIDGAASKTLTTQYDTVTVYSDGTTWWIL